MATGKASTADRPTEGSGAGPTGQAPAQETGLSDSELEKQDQENKEQDPDVDQSDETVGGEEPRDTNPTKVRYRGIGTHRIITVPEWNEAGVTGQSFVQWNRSNNYTVEVGDQPGQITLDAVARIRGDAEFSVE